jgi:hypothetical protein
MAFELKQTDIAKVTDYIAIKQPARVFKQTPAPGTPVLEGMTIEVQTVSYSDVPYYVLDDDAPVAMRNIPLAEIEKVIINDDYLKAATESGTVTDPATYAAKLTTGLAKLGYNTTIPSTDSTKLAQSFKLIGFTGH